MKNLLTIYMACFGLIIFKAQTFTNNTVSNAGSWNASLTKTITVSGLPTSLTAGVFELVQVNLHMGDAANTRNYNTYRVRLTKGTNIATDPTIDLIATGGMPNSVIQQFNTKFRYHSVLRRPFQHGGTTEPFHIGYYRSQEDYAAFNNLDPNGDWTITITETSSADGGRFNSVDLVFGSPIVVQDFSGITTYDDCLTPFCLVMNKVFLASNNGFTNNNTHDMYNGNTSGCDWNAARNNSAWHQFVASATTAHLTISGLADNLQVLAVGGGADNNPCTPSDNVVLTGGCPANTTINDTYLSPQYTNGSTRNMQLNLSGLTVGETYYFIVDGTGGAISPFYVEITGASPNCFNCDFDGVVANSDTADTETKIGMGSHVPMTSGFPTNRPSGYLAFDSSTKGMVIPRVSTANRPAGAAGLMIYNTDLNCVQFHNGTIWKCIEPDCN
jgi:hypothetical protein